MDYQGLLKECQGLIKDCQGPSRIIKGLLRLRQGSGAPGAIPSNSRNLQEIPRKFKDLQGIPSVLEM